LLSSPPFIINKGWGGKDYNHIVKGDVYQIMKIIDKQKVLLYFTIVLFLMLTLTSLNLATENPPLPKLEKPIFVTSCGQSPDFGTVDLLGRRAGVEMKVNHVALPEEIVGYKTLIIVIGGSGKGLGAAGIDIPEEVKRVEELIKKASEEEIFILGMHIGGVDRRGPVSADFVPFAAEADYLVVRTDGNEDGFFTNVAEENEIPLFLIEKTPELVDIFKEMFAEENETTG